MRIAQILLVLLLSFAAFPAQAVIENGLDTPITAPEIGGTGPWLNSPPLTSKDLKGKVVLVDFWTYSCINCLRTLPYIKAWYEQYKDKGFVVLGIHAPEFDFEKNTANVEKALKRFNVTYPVVQDNDHVLWDRFANRYWPAHYLINRDGKIVYTHFGEGHYDVTEQNIRTLLDEKGGMAKVEDAGGGTAFLQSPETYLGFARAEHETANPAQKLEADTWSLSGKWQRAAEYIESTEAGSSLKFHFRGGKLFLVLGSADGRPHHAQILFNGKPALDAGGKDVKDGVVEIADHRLYELINLHQNGEGVFELKTDTSGLRAYAFTFGGV